MAMTRHPAPGNTGRGRRLKPKQNDMIKPKTTKLGVCDCLRPAVVKKASGLVCARCLHLEQLYYGLDILGRRKNAKAMGRTR